MMLRARSLVLIVSIFLISPIVTEAKAPAEGIAMLRLAKFKNWDELIADLDAYFPEPVVKEFKGVVSDLPFPKIRVEKKNLVLVDPVNGRQWKFALGKGGTATLNGRNLHIKPLETVQAEVQRIIADNQIDNKSAGSLSLISEAVADQVAGAGAAAAAYGGAQVHKAKACLDAETAEEVKRDCSPMGYMGPLTEEDRVQHARSKIEDPYLPLGLKCPQENGAIMEQVLKTKSGYLARIRTKFDDIVPGKMSIEGAKMGGKFLMWIRSDPTDEKDEKLHDYVMSKNLDAYYLFDEVCVKGKEKDRKRYMAMLDANKLKTRQDSADDSGGTSGGSTTVQ